MSEAANLLGKTVGNYRIKSLLGEGGMGAVYLAENPSIESRVAIKVLHPAHGVESTIVQRFMGEARAVNRVGHPNIVRIHDFGQQEGVGIYLIMEYLEGLTLRDELHQQGPLSPGAVINIISQSASALGEVHRQGIVHRDLKPENFMLVPDPTLPGGQRLKILDFGIAKLSEDKHSMGSSTMTGVIFGSPSYMSHEQCCDTKNVDLRTDIYSAGVIAYELLTGELPYEAESIGELVRRQLLDPPVPPSKHNPRVPERMDRAVLKALAVEPGDRYASMASFASALELTVDSVPPLALEHLPLDREPASRKADSHDTALLSDRPQVLLSEMATASPRSGENPSAAGEPAHENSTIPDGRPPAEALDRSAAAELEQAAFAGGSRTLTHRVLPAVAVGLVLLLSTWVLFGRRPAATSGGPTTVDSAHLSAAGVATSEEPDAGPGRANMAAPAPREDADSAPGKVVAPAAPPSPRKQQRRRRKPTRRQRRAKKTAPVEAHPPKGPAARRARADAGGAAQPFRSLGGPKKKGGAGAPAVTPFKSLGPMPAPAAPEPAPTPPREK